MALNIGSMGGTALGWFRSIFFWVLFIFGFAVLTIVFLKVRKWRKLKIPVIETIKISNQRVAILQTKGGWFKTRSTFFGMYDYGGDDRFLLADGREVQSVSAEDYQDVNGGKGLIVRRKGDDPQVLVPVHDLSFTPKSDALIMDVAPADYRDASSKILSRNETEAVSKFERTLTLILPYVMIGFFIVAMILTFQYARGSQSESWVKTLEAIKLAQENRNVVIASSAPFLLFFKRKWFK